MSIRAVGKPGPATQKMEEDWKATLRLPNGEEREVNVVEEGDLEFRPEFPSMQGGGKGSFSCCLYHSESDGAGGEDVTCCSVSCDGCCCGLLPCCC